MRVNLSCPVCDRPTSVKWGKETFRCPNGHNVKVNYSGTHPKAVMMFDGTYPNPKREFVVRESGDGRKPGDES